MAENASSHIIPPHMVGTGDTVAAMSIMAAVFDWLPTALGIIGGLLGVLWYAVLFYDRFLAKKPPWPKNTN